MRGPEFSIQDKREFLLVGGIIMGLAGVYVAAQQIPETMINDTNETNEPLFESPSSIPDEVESTQETIAFDVAKERLNAQAIFIAHDVLDQLENPNYGAKTYSSSTPDDSFGFPNSVTNKEMLAGPDGVFNTPDDDMVYPEVRAAVFFDGPYAEEGSVVEFLSVSYAEAEQGAAWGFHSMRATFLINEDGIKTLENAGAQNYRNLLSSNHITFKEAEVGFASKYDPKTKKSSGDRLLIKEQDDELIVKRNYSDVDMEITNADDLNWYLDQMNGIAANYKETLPS